MKTSLKLSFLLAISGSGFSLFASENITTQVNEPESKPITVLIDIDDLKNMNQIGGGPLLKHDTEKLETYLAKLEALENREFENNILKESPKKK